MHRPATRTQQQAGLLAPPALGTWLRRITCMVCCGLLPLMVLAQQDRATNKAFWEEPCHTRQHPPTLADVPQEAFEAYEGVLARGYSTCAVWVRVLLAPAEGATVLRIQPTYLDEITLHDPLLRAATVRGDRFPPEAGTLDRAIRFTVPGGEAPRHVWLRLSTSSTRMLDLQAVSPQSAQALEQRSDWLQGALLLLLAAPLPWAVLQWFHVRERLMVVFAAKQTAMLAWALLVMGYGPSLLGAVLPPTGIDLLTSVLAMVVVCTSLWFERTLLAGYQVPRWGLRVMRAIMAMLPVLLLMLFGDHASAALQVNITFTWLGALLATLMYAVARVPPPDGSPVATLPPRLLAAYCSLSLAALTLAVGMQLGLIAGGSLIMSTLFVHSVLSSVVMMVLLNVRASMQARAVGALAAAQIRAQQERLHREEQERLVGMLVHEMRTPLAAVRMLLGEGQPSPQQFDRVQRSLADMNGLLERCAQASQLEGEGLQPQWTACDLRQALEDIASGWRDADRLAVEISPALAQSAQVQADPYWLRIILGNLIDNACKYSPPGSRVNVMLAAHTDLSDPARPRAGFCLEVANLPGSAGWPDAQRLFAKYYRSPFARRSTGSGLGLYLVAGLARSLNGHIHYDPTPDQVRFRLWLPT